MHLIKLHYLLLIRVITQALLNYLIALLTFAVLPEISNAAYHNGYAQFSYLTQPLLFSNKSVASFEHCIFKLQL